MKTNPPCGSLTFTLGRLAAFLVFSAAAPAQIVFQVSDVPGKAGEDSWKEWEDRSGKDPRPFTGSTGGPQRWDFSYRKADSETVVSTSIVPPDDGGIGGSYPQAVFAERTTNEAGGCGNWSYFRLTPGTGRTAFGFHDACRSPATDVVYSPPLVDLPASIAHGQSWHGETTWNDTFDFGVGIFDVAIHFTSDAQADAYGTVILPMIGEVPALRVSEIHTYQTTELSFGIAIDEYSVRNCYWLVPGMGKAVQIISPASTAIPPPDFPSAAAILRVFESSRFPQRQPVTDLRIARSGNHILLTWNQEPDAAGYDVESVLRLSDSPWTPLASAGGNSYLDAATDPPSKFYRVFWKK